MTDHSITTIPADTPLPADDLNRSLTVVLPDDPSIPHISQAGNVYTILVSGEQTEGRYTLIDMLVPDGGGPPPHRHDFEEMFTLLEGELEFTFRGETQIVRAPATVNIPANAPHRFANRSGKMAHMLCMCTPAGQEEFFLSIADRIPDRQSPAPKPDAATQAEKKQLAESLAPRYRTEFLTAK
ncbi:cupin domain-containing protein [Agrobacterium tumefaciens]|jgi:quercetin dioxygenase-like cupin family protein|uniref:cupin domain-containing protein n=1 Tax=Agrobacterium tumefaciens TaxID=358 RepID=UPI00157375DF|nr:cupin domain-containing protein [Agrobacterium tumefaciens]UXS39491.1 cupin domain-containing protein [Agrobacterium tumefaciens]UXT22444.1 cupin domain-containing protein [Agrobacterium tumefaciens]WHO22674.1 cupin domain-containing protein [Agrobacterium tumefaciens]